MPGEVQNRLAVRGGEKRGRGAYPFEVAIVVHPHHLAATHAHDERASAQLIEPDEHDAELGLSGAVGSIDDRLETHAALKNKFMAARGGDRGQFIARWANDYAETSEGVQGLEDVVVEARRPVFEFRGEFRHELAPRVLARVGKGGVIPLRSD